MTTLDFITELFCDYCIRRGEPFGCELSEQQTGRKGKSNHRWIVGGKLYYVLNDLGLIVSWDCDTANIYDGRSFQ